jgi:Zn-finger nucleic acid-binding protein
MNPTLASERMQASTLRCPGCGAPADADETSCRYCKARLATVSCPKCFALAFLGAKHCAQCGAALQRSEGSSGDRTCPRCDGTLAPVQVGGTALDECGGCSGVWIGVEALRALLDDREGASVVLAPGTPTARSQAQPESTVRYLRCPECGDVMGRVNYARISGVVVDVCRRHGTWFDADELRRVVEFVRDGGLDRARGRERMMLEEERRRLEMLRAMGPAAGTSGAPGGASLFDDRGEGVDLGEVLRNFLKAVRG